MVSQDLRNRMPRFVILQHELPAQAPRPSHWDFMLKDGSILLTWELPSPADACRQMSARKLADHRVHYLDYEGPISGDRGHVRKWDQGTFTWEQRAPGRMVVQLSGEKLKGLVSLTSAPCPTPPELQDQQAWLFRYEAS